MLGNAIYAGVTTMASICEKSDLLICYGMGVPLWDHIC